MTSHIINSIYSILQQYPYAGVKLLSDLNTLNDKSLRAYPLQQLVVTHGKAILDQIHTNIADWYERPITMNIIMLPYVVKTQSTTTCRLQLQLEYTRNS